MKTNKFHYTIPAKYIKIIVLSYKFRYFMFKNANRLRIEMFYYAGI